jgi:hypothetical protein
MVSPFWKTLIILKKIKNQDDIDFISQFFPDI